MSLPIFTVSINGGAFQPCADLGWSVESLARKNMAPDVVTLTRVMRPSLPRAGIVHGDKLAFRMDGQPWFYGTAQAPSFSLRETGRTVSLQVLGPWYDLDQLTYVRNPHLEGSVLSYLPNEVGDTFFVTAGTFSVWDPVSKTWVLSVESYYTWSREDDLTPDGATPATAKKIDIARFTSARGLLCDPDWDADPPYYRTLAAEVRSLVGYFFDIYALLGLTAPFAVDLDTLTDGLGANVTPRFRTFQDSKVGQLIAELMAAKPHCVAWFDYTQFPPELKMSEPSAEVTLTPGETLKALDATPAHGLRAAGFVIRWETETVYGWRSRGWKVGAIDDKYPATVLPHDPGVVTFTLDLLTDGGVNSYRPELAQALYESLSTLRANGSMVLTSLSAVDASAIRPGLTYRVAADEDLSQAQLLVQDTVWNIRSGTVSCSLGYPRTLDLNTLRDLRGWLSVGFSGWTGSYSEVLQSPA